jgi:hypothetical protein
MPEEGEEIEMTDEEKLAFVRQVAETFGLDLGRN